MPTPKRYGSTKNILSVRRAFETFSKIALKWPQTAYSGFTFVLQKKRQYVQRVVVGIEALFDPLERMILYYFLPSLIVIPACEIDGDYRTLLSHSVNTRGLAVHNPLETPIMPLKRQK